MATDAHYNEPGGVPPALEDHKPTDMPATRWMFYIIAGAMVLFMGVALVNYFNADEPAVPEPPPAATAQPS